MSYSTALPNLGVLVVIERVQGIEFSHSHLCNLYIYAIWDELSNNLTFNRERYDCGHSSIFQGSGHSAPTLRMVNVHDGLYLIHFQQPLSALQSFSIAVAIIHTRSPTLWPKNLQELQ